VAIFQQQHLFPLKIIGRNFRPIRLRVVRRHSEHEGFVSQGHLSNIFFAQRQSKQCGVQITLLQHSRDIRRLSLGQLNL
jgi:hypothetical protein